MHASGAPLKKCHLKPCLGHKRHGASTRYTFRNYKADQFANDVGHIPWDTMNLIDESVDNSPDVFNDLLLACLDDHAPIKTVKIRHKPTLSSRRT